MIKTFQPAIQVKLIKLIDRKNGVSKRYQGIRREIDLTPYLGEAGGVRTSKSIYEPAGAFTITLADRMDQRSQDSLYGLIEPMDYVEIRMARQPHRHAGRPLPIVMRGFVCNVRRTETMTPEGRPVRAVVVSGQDYGKIFGMAQIFYDKAQAFGQDLLTTFRLFTNYGISFNTMPAAQFVQEVVALVNRRYIAALRSHAKPPAAGEPGAIFDIQAEARVAHGVVGPYGVNPYEGSIWNFLRTWCDLPWNELFVEDRDDGVYLVYRPVPFKDLQGNLILSGATDPGQVDVTAESVVAIDVTRSDQGIANYYWVDAPRFILNSGGMLRMTAFQSALSTQTDYYLADYANADPNLYGLRVMELQSNQGADGQTTRGDGLPAAQQVQADSSNAAWLTQRRHELIQMNRDNVVYEAGALQVQGDEALRAGRYLHLTRGTLRSEYYVTQVDHEYVPFARFTSTVQVSRGTGFLERTRREAGRQSPYLSEGRKGVYG